MLVDDAGLRVVKGLGVCRREPGWGSGRGSAENHLETELVSQIHSPVEEVKTEYPFARLKDRPPKLGQTDDAQAKLTHVPKIIRPECLRPLLRVVTRSNL